MFERSNHRRIVQDARKEENSFSFTRNKKEKGLEDEEKDKKVKENVIRRIKRKGRKILKIGRTEERNGTR